MGSGGVAPEGLDSGGRGGRGGMAFMLKSDANGFVLSGDIEEVRGGLKWEDDGGSGGVGPAAGLDVRSRDGNVLADITSMEFDGNGNVQRLGTESVRWFEGPRCGDQSLGKAKADLVGELDTAVYTLASRCYIATAQPQSAVG